jgi:cyclopropane fatty-acyl-phospholipid synthase-like methyltransferase
LRGRDREGARQRDLVRRGYDAISLAYRSDASVDAVVSFYALIHVPLADHRALFPRVREWVRPGGCFLAIVGAGSWTGTEQYLGAEMFWDHADTDSYLPWLAAARPLQPWPYVRRQGRL